MYFDAINRLERYMPLDGMSLDQLRTFIAAADEGSFSAASAGLLQGRHPAG
jgi:hypothetical protein